MKREEKVFTKIEENINKKRFLHAAQYLSTFTSPSVLFCQKTSLDAEQRSWVSTQRVNRSIDDTHFKKGKDQTNTKICINLIIKYVL